MLKTSTDALVSCDLVNEMAMVMATAVLSKKATAKCDSDSEGGRMQHKRALVLFIWVVPGGWQRSAPIFDT
jgi:hypothetical protein